MRTRLIAGCLATALVLSMSAAAIAEDGINPIGEHFIKAFKAGDADAVAALYAPDAVSYPPDAMEAVGRDAIRESWGGLFKTYNVQDLIISNAHHETESTLSCAWGYFKMILVPKAGGDPVTMEGRFTDVARKIDGQWQYLNDHASVPLPPNEETTEADDTQ